MNGDAEMKEFLKCWFATTKHIVISDSEEGFQKLFVHTVAELESLNMVIVRVRMRKKRYNHDVHYYNPNYKALLWTIPKEDSK